MKLNKLFLLMTVMALVFALGFVVACGDDDDDDDDDDATADDDDDDDDNDDTTDGDVVEELLQQAYDGCMQYWEDACTFDNADADEICQAWADAYRPGLEAFADGINLDCMNTLMAGFFECLGSDCDPAGAWMTCNGEVEEQMLECFE